MSANLKEFSKNMLKIFTIISNLTEEEIQNALERAGMQPPKGAKPKEKAPIPQDLGQHSEQILSLNTRKEAIDYIDSLKFSKEKLLQLADSLKVNVNKSDKKEVITNKIVESVVGFKLRTEAIMTMDLKR